MPASEQTFLKDPIYLKKSSVRSVTELSRRQKSGASAKTIFLNARFEIHHCRATVAPLLHRCCTVAAPLLHRCCTVDAQLMHCRGSVALCTLFKTLGIYSSGCSKVSNIKKAAPSAPHFFRAPGEKYIYSPLSHR